MFNPTPTPPGGSPTYDFCGKSFDEVVTSCDRLCETNLDCLTGEVCFGGISSTDCNGTLCSYVDFMFFLENLRLTLEFLPTAIR